MARVQLTGSKFSLSIIAGKMVMLRGETTYNSGCLFMIPVDLCPRMSTTDAIVVVRQVKCLIVHKYIFRDFLNLEKKLTVPLENLSS